MYLGQAYNESYSKRRIRELTTNGYIRVYKVVHLAKKSFTCLLRWRGKYKSGVQTAKLIDDKEWISNSGDWGWYAFTDRRSAEIYADCPKNIVIECLAKPEWILDIGHDEYGCEKLRTIRLKKLCFPQFPKTKVTVKEFREALKKENV